MMSENLLLKMKSEFDYGTSPLDGWNHLTGDKQPDLGPPLSSAADITESVSNQSSPILTTPNESITTTTTNSTNFNTDSPLINVNNNDEKICSSPPVQDELDETPQNDQGDFVKQIESNTDSSQLILSRENALSNDLKLPQSQNDLKPPLNIVSQQLEQTQEEQKELAEKFAENKSAFELLEKRHEELQFKVNANESLLQKNEQPSSVLQLDHDDQPVSGDKSTSDEVLQTLKALQDQLEQSEFKANVNKSLEEKDKQIKEIQDQMAVSQLELSEFKANVNKLFEEKDKQIKSLKDEISELRASNNASTSGEETLSTVSNQQNMDFISQNSDDDDSATEVEDESPTQNDELRRVTRKRKPSRLGGRDAMKKIKSTQHQSAKNRATVLKNNTRTRRLYTIVSLNCTEADCHTKLHSLKGLYDHLKKHHKVKPRRCFVRECDRRFDNTTQLNAHIASHDDVVEFVCPAVDCLMRTTSKNYAYDHWNGYHLTGEYKCNKCASVMDTRKKLYNHNVECADLLGRFACKHPGCSATFAYPSFLSIHQTKHLGKQFQCIFAECTQRFATNGNLVKHIREVHS